jgi:lysophospholipase L1-like esterase
VSTRRPEILSRYVALGDSQTEGLGDGDDTTGYRGWADRLAEHLAELNPDFGTPTSQCAGA